MSDNSRIDEAEKVIVDWPGGIKKPIVGIVTDNYTPPSWTKYQRFCRTNEIPFCTLNIHGHDWGSQVSTCDLIVGHPSGAPSRLDELWRKTYIMERWLGKVCYPSSADLALYEDKHTQHDALRTLNFPVIPTWVSYDEDDALELASKLEYPLVSKLIIGAGSRGVELVQNRRAAEQVIRRAFSARGRYWHWPYLRQKDYILFQKFIPTDGYDVRVICLGDMMFGYYRKARKGDFRASGSGIVEKRGLSESVLRMAHSAAQALQAPYLSVDFLMSTSGEQFITEVAHFNLIETPEQLHVEGVPGAYVIDQEGSIRFKPGRFWVQELALKRVCEQYAGVQVVSRTPINVVMPGTQPAACAVGVAASCRSAARDGGSSGRAGEKAVIKSIAYRKLLNSHVDFTTEFILRFTDGSVGWGASPKGETISMYEDQDTPTNPEAIVRQMEKDGCLGRAFDQETFDAYLAGRIDRFGRNNTYGLSLAFFSASGVTRSRFELFGREEGRLVPPRLCCNILNGGWHAYTNPVLSEFSEFLLVAATSDIETVVAGHNAIQMAVKEKLRTLDTAIIGGNRVYRFSTADNRAPIEFLLQIRDELGLSRQFDLMIDASASDLWEENAYRLSITDGSVRTSDEFREYWQGLIRDFGLVYLEDPLHEQDEEAWSALTAAQKTCRIIGDNFYSSDAERISRLAAKRCTHGVIIKPNQAGSISAVRRAVDAAQRHGQLLISSHRSISTEETFISLLTCMTAVPLIKIGPLQTDYSSVMRLNEILRLTRAPGV